MDNETKKYIFEYAFMHPFIQCIYISKKDKFFVFRRDQADEIRKEVDDFEYNPPIEVYTCAIYHNGRLIHESEVDIIEKYLKAYGRLIDSSPAFYIFHLFGSNEFTLTSTKYVTPIKKFLKEAGVLWETRGKKKDDWLAEYRDKFMYKTYKALGGSRKLKKIPLGKIKNSVLKQGETLYRDSGKNYEKFVKVSDDTINRAIKKGKDKKRKKRGVIEDHMDKLGEVFK